MPWIKRNLVLVVGGLVALGLLAFAIFFMLGRIGKDREITEQLDTQTAQFKDLLNRPVHPGTDQVDNIAAAKAEHKRLVEFLAELKKFVPTVTTNRSNSREFRTLLDNTVLALRAEAEKKGVTLPSTNYWFTFDAQKSVVQFNPTNVNALAAQLSDIRSLCKVLLDAKVPAITQIKRVPVSSEDTLGSSDYTNLKPTTNDLAISTPYEITFHGFTTELAKVLEGLTEAPECFIVKNITVDKASNPQATPSPDTMMMNPYANMMDRYGGSRSRMSRYNLPPPVVAPPVSAPPVQKPVSRSGLTTILDESKLRITMHVAVVKLKAKQ